MTLDLLLDIFYAAPEFWYITLGVVAIIAFGFVYFLIQSLRLTQKNYFLNRDRERYAESLYASKDGYFAFIYPDQRVNDPRKKLFERCSRRLAVMLSLENGTKANFDDVLKMFYKDDARKIAKYVDLLMEQGVSFEDEFIIKKDNKNILLSGSRISGMDGNLYCDLIWFRDISFEAQLVNKLQEQTNQALDDRLALEHMLDNCPHPMWMRDDKLKLININKKYLEMAGISNKELALDEGAEILNINGDSISKNLAFLAVSSNKPKKQIAGINIKGKRKIFEIVETPFYNDQDMSKIFTVGTMVDISELDELKRNIKNHQSSHLEILTALDTAFAVFDSQQKLSFYNSSYAALWKFEDVWLESKPSYTMFLDLIREKRLSPEVPDFIQYKKEESDDFNKLIEAKEDLLHLPDGRSIRRIRAPHPMGGLIFAYEDISDKLATRRAYNSLLTVRKEILDNLDDGILIFGSEGRLKFNNKAYLREWNAQDSFLKKEPSLEEVMDSQQEFFDIGQDWPALKKEMIKYISDIAAERFVIRRKDDTKMEVTSTLLSDGSIMIVYKIL